MINIEKIQRIAVTQALVEELKTIKEDLEAAESQFEEAHGLFIDAFILKLAYLKAYRSAVLNELMILEDKQS